MSTAPLAFIDVETTSLAKATRLPWEIAVIRRNPDGTETEWSAFVATNLEHADPMSLRIGRYYERHPHALVQPGQDPLRVAGVRDVAQAWVAAKRVEWMTRGAVLVGAVPSFDEHTLDRFLRDNGLCPSWSHRPLDVESYAAGVLGWPVPRGLGETAKALGIAVLLDAEHTALGDARLARFVYDAVLSRSADLIGVKGGE